MGVDGAGCLIDTESERAKGKKKNSWVFPSVLVHCEEWNVRKKGTPSPPPLLSLFLFFLLLPYVLFVSSLLFLILLPPWKLRIVFVFNSFPENWKLLSGLWHGTIVNCYDLYFLNLFCFFFFLLLYFLFFFGGCGLQKHQIVGISRFYFLFSLWCDNIGRFLRFNLFPPSAEVLPAALRPLRLPPVVQLSFTIFYTTLRKASLAPNMQDHICLFHYWG